MGSEMGPFLAFLTGGSYWLPIWERSLGMAAIAGMSGVGLTLGPPLFWILRSSNLLLWFKALAFVAPDLCSIGGEPLVSPTGWPS